MENKTVNNSEVPPDPDAGKATRSPLWSVAHAIAVVVLSFLFGLLFSLIGILLVSATSPFGEIVLTILQYLGFGVGVALYLQVTGQWSLLTRHVRVPTLRDAGWWLAGLLVIFIASNVLSQVLAWAGIHSAQNNVITAGKGNPQFYLYMIPVSLLFVGPFEELVFRAGVQGILRQSFGRWSSIIGAALFFGVVHYVALSGSGSRLSYIAVAAVLGLVLGYLYDRTGNLAVNAGVHGSYDALLFAIQYLAATGALH